MVIRALGLVRRPIPATMPPRECEAWMRRCTAPGTNMPITRPSDRYSQLQTGAEEWLADFGEDPLTADEKSFLERATQGNKLRPMEGRTSEPRDKTIRAALIRWLCSDNDAQALLWPEGIGLEFAEIKGEKLSFLKYNGVGLNLSSLKIPFPIILHHCILPDWLLLLGSDIPFLDLDGCKIDSIRADVLNVRGDVYMRCVDHKVAGGVVKLLGATIGGDLDLGGARLKYGGAGLADRFPDEKQLVLNAEGIKVEGDVHFTTWVRRNRNDNQGEKERNKKEDDRVKFSAEGGISLDEAQIGSDLNCKEASLGLSDKAVDEGNALTLRGATVKGNIYFSKG